MFNLGSSVELLTAGNRAADDGVHRRAVKLFRRALKRGSIDAALNLGNSLLALGDVAGAVVAFRTGWTQGDADAGYNLAVALEDSGGIEPAFEVYAELTRVGYAAAAIQLAWLLRSRGAEAKAEDMLRDATHDQGEAGDLASGTLGHWLHSTGNREPSTRALLARGAEAYPTARVDMAELMFELGSDVEALEMLREGATKGETESMLPLGNYHWERGDLDEAQNLYERARVLGDRNSAENLEVLLEEKRGRDAQMS